jgi:ATP-dependent DNA helicase RecQ
MDRGFPSCPSQSLEAGLASAQGDLQEVPREWLLLDLEGGRERVFQIGAVFGGHVFERRGRFDLSRALRELDGFADAAQAVLGHNILDHDLPILKQAASEMRLFHKPVIDTLFLSPLAFPENPYHRLVKDHKLVKDSVNDPVADARLAARVFCDQMRGFQVLAEAGSADILAFYRYCFDSA